MIQQVEQAKYAGVSLGELIAAGRIELMAPLPSSVGSIRILSIDDDSRAVGRGGCFVAVRGGHVDGHAFVTEAVARGASVVVSEDAVSLPADVALVRVRDARSALAKLAAAYYGLAGGQRYAGLRAVAITGTNGKTTTGHLLRAILQRAGHGTALLGTVGYDLVGERWSAPWTTPPPMVLCRCLAVAAGRGATHAVMEVSSHALSQSRCDGLSFAGGVFTNLSGDHLDYHDDVQSYMSAKKRLFDGLDAGGFAVVNADDERSAYMISSCRGRAVRFGFSGGVDVRATVRELGVDGSSFSLSLPDGEAYVSLRLAGLHNVSNAAAAAAAACAMGVGREEIAAGLAGVAQVPGRLQRVDVGRCGFHVFVDYAHTDDALANVLGAVRSLTGGRVVCVFGCGGDRDRTKRPRMGSVVSRLADVAVVTSDNPRSEDPRRIIDDILPGLAGADGCEVYVEPDRAAAIGRAVRLARAGDAVLIAGKGHEEYQIVGDERRHFDDVEVARSCLVGMGGLA